MRVKAISHRLNPRVEQAVTVLPVHSQSQDKPVDLATFTRGNADLD